MTAPKLPDLPTTVNPIPTTMFKAGDKVKIVSEGTPEENSKGVITEVKARTMAMITLDNPVGVEVYVPFGFLTKIDG